MEAARALDSYPDPAGGGAVFDPVPPTLRAVEALATEVLDPVRAAVERRRARHAHELTTLLGRRADLRGVSVVADHFAEYVRWTV
jgi:hypothetical protein